MSTGTNLSRRGFFSTEGGLVLGFVLQKRLTDQQIGVRPPTLFVPSGGGKPNVYIHIGTDERVIFKGDRPGLNQHVPRVRAGFPQRLPIGADGHAPDRRL